MSKQGNIAEGKAVFHFLKEGYEVYTSFGTGCSCDLILLKDGKTFRVSVKSTTRKCSKSAWEVSLRQARYKHLAGFDNRSCDILAVYIEPEDRILVYNAQDIVSKRCLIIKMLK